MPKKCPPGVICIENVTLFILVILGTVILYFFYSCTDFMKRASDVSSHSLSQSHTFNDIKLEAQPRITLPALLNRTDVYSDPYAPPLKTNVFLSNSGDVRGVPVNVHTQGRPSNYTQVGLLTRNAGKDTILPLFGRELLSNRDKWQYYTMNDKNNAIKLPISINGKSCTGEYGCDSLYNGDNVYVEGYNDIFNVTVYENNAIQYIPVL